MKKAWIWIALILVLVAAGIYAYLNYGVSADSMFNKSNDLTCISKEIPNKVLFNPGGSDNNYIGTKSVKLNTSEKASPEGIFLKKGNTVYFTNGLRYSALPEVLSSNVVTFKIGDIYYIADINTATDISAVTLTGGQVLLAYKEYAYTVDLSSPSKESAGYLYQKNGITRICSSANSYEFDVARKGYQILGEGVTKYTYDIKVHDLKTKTEILPFASSVDKETYDVALNQEFYFVDSWTPSDPGGTAKITILKGSEYLRRSSGNTFAMVKNGVAVIQKEYTLPDGSKIFDTVTIMVGKG